MEKSQRQKLYDWVLKNKDNHGATYKTLLVGQHDYDLIRIRLRSGYKFADWHFKRIDGNKIELVVYIK